MNVIFTTLSKPLYSVATALRKIGIGVYYLDRPDDPESLACQGVFPLPLADIPWFEGYEDVDADTTGKTIERRDELVSPAMLQSVAGLYDIKDGAKKLGILVHNSVAMQELAHTARLRIWATAYPNQFNIVISTDYRILFAPTVAPNYRVLYLPIRRGAPSKKPSPLPLSPLIVPTKRTDQKIALITHMGLTFGNLFKKDLYYSDAIKKPDVLHIDYHGIKCPEPGLSWVTFNSHCCNTKDTLAVLTRGLPHIRRLSHIIGLIELMREYALYRSYRNHLTPYKNLKLALIDFDVLCPKELILALESRGIETVATQERFGLTFNNLLGSVIATHYLCASQYAADVMAGSPLNAVEHYEPVGLHRSDYIWGFWPMAPPDCLKEPLSKGKRIIVAFGFHTYTAWETSQADLLCNWKAHRQFLEDMLRLSEDINGVFIILRYKHINWITSPEFADLLQKIHNSDNITISEDYSESHFSYRLCAYSDLVIAKSTSIADECLSFGIPVLFHEYMHNTDSLVSGAFDYLDAGIDCHSYDELVMKAKAVLVDTIPRGKYSMLKQTLFGNLGDGNTRERVRRYVEKLIR